MTIQMLVNWFSIISISSEQEVYSCTKKFLEERWWSKMDKTKSLKINIEQFSYTPSNPIFLKNKIEIGLGEIVGIVAPNGYGKSTLMDIIAGNIVSSNCEIF